MPDWKKLFETTKEQVGEGVKVAGQGLRVAAEEAKKVAGVAAEEAKKAAGEAKKVAGIGVGTIVLTPSRSGYELGDTIHGTLELQLSEPVPAKRLVVALRATRKRYVKQRGSDGRVSPVQRDETLVDHEVELAGERTYQSGVHRFTVPIPARMDAKVEIDGLLGDALRAAQTLRSMTESPIRWKLVAFLDIPWKRNLSKEIDLAIRGD